VRLLTHAEHSQAVEGISSSDVGRVKNRKGIRCSVRTWTQGYMREGDRDENHKEDCNYKEEGHVARLIVSVASHGRREIVGAGELFSLHVNLFKSRRREGGKSTGA
jgi:hypothetical protein